MEARPFLKWVGGKRQLLPDLRRRLPLSFGSYFEPFLGGGALFFDLYSSGRLAGKRVRLSDKNAELIDTYTAVRDWNEEVVFELGKHVYDRDYYYEVRAQDPLQLTLAQRAARMIYLNRAGFNGLYRVNKSGKFNVPFGRYSNPQICDAENLRMASLALQNVEIVCEPFESVRSQCSAGDLVYFDPPYTPVSRTANFTSYVSDAFAGADQRRLRDLFVELSERGVHAIVSNADTQWVRDEYRTARIDSVKARRAVNCKSDSRTGARELIIQSAI